MKDSRSHPQCAVGKHVSFTVPGWCFQPFSSHLKTKINWDDDIPNIWKNTSHVPNHQPGAVLSLITGFLCSPFRAESTRRLAALQAKDDRRCQITCSWRCGKPHGIKRPGTVSANFMVDWGEWFMIGFTKASTIFL